MNRITRRQFAQLAALAPVAAAFRRAPAPQQPEQPKGEKKLKLTPDQEERVKQAVERRERQLAAIRSRTLPYDAEPAFIFRVEGSWRLRDGTPPSWRPGGK